MNTRLDTAMKFFDCNREAMFNFCLLWEDIPEDSQSLYLNELSPPVIPVEEVNVFLARPLVNNGFLKFSASKKNYEFTKEAKQFHKLLNSLDSHNLFTDSNYSITRLIDYLRFFYTSEERLTLTERCRSYRKDDEDLATQIGSAYWLKRFLGTANHRVWQTRIDTGRQLSFDSNPGFNEDFILAQKIVKTLISGENPIPLTDVLTWADMKDTQLMSKAIYLLLKNMLVFLAVDDLTGMPVMGILPSIHNFINPENIELEKSDSQVTACPPFLVDDMTILLIEISVNPMPLRQNDESPYAKSVKEISSRFYQLPAVCNYLHLYTIEERIRMAMSVLQRENLATISRKKRKYHFVALNSGKNWLNLNETEKLENTIEGMRNHYAYTKHEDLTRSRFQPSSKWLSKINTVRQEHKLTHKPPDLSGSVFGALKKLAAVKHTVTERSFMRNQIFEENPFFTLFHSGVPYPDSHNWQDDYIIDHTAMINSWSRVLQSFIANKAIPCGFINLGKIDDDGSHAISLTDAGLYVIGELDTLPESKSSDNSILIQPNFEIVFMAQNPRAEVKLGQFCERLGSGMGTLFRISRKSILKGASNGLDSEFILNAMHEVSHKPVPANVTEQVKNWISLCRLVSISTKILFTCPDKVTALQVKSSGGDKVEQISDTVIAVSDRKFAGALEKKLEKKGIFRKRG